MSDKPTKPKPKDTRTRGQKWRRRLTVAIVTLAIVGLAVRALVPMLLPTVMRGIARSYGLTAEYDKFEFYMIGGDVGLWNLRFTPIEGGEPVIQVDYCRGSVSTLALLRGSIHVQRAEAEGASITVERLADGTIPLLDKILGTAPAQPAPAPASAAPISLEPPVSIRALRLQHAQARLLDRAVSPATDVRFGLNMMVNNVGSLERATQFSIQLSSPEMLGALYIDGQGASRDNRVEAELKVRMFGLDPRPLQAYLANFGLAPNAADLSADATGQLTVTPARGASGQPAQGLAAQVRFNNVSLSADSRPVAGAKRVAMDIGLLAPGEIRVDSIAVDSVIARASRDAAGKVGFAGIAIGAVPATQPAGAVAAPSSGTSKIPVIELKSVQIKDVQLGFDDLFLDPPAKIDLNVDSIAVANLTNDLSARQRATLRVAARAPGMARSITVDGSMAPNTGENRVEMKLAVTGIDPVAIEPYLSPLGVRRTISDGSLVCDLTGTFGQTADGSVKLNLKASNVLLSDAGNRWFGIPGASLNAVEIRPDFSRVKFGSIELEGPELRISRAKNGSITAIGFTLDPAAIPAAAPSTQPSGAPPQVDLSALARLPAIEIGNLHWGKTSLVFDDATEESPARAALENFDLRLTDLLLDPNSKATKNGKLTLSAQSPDNIESVRVDGTIESTGPEVVINLAGSAGGVTLHGLKPLLKAAGLAPELKDGKLTFSATAKLRRTSDAIHAGVVARDMIFSDGDRAWLKAAGAEIDEASFDGRRLDVKSIAINQPVLHLDRDASGGVAAMGLRWVGVPARSVPTDEPAIPSRIDLSLPFLARLGKVTVSDASLSLRDESVSPGVAIAPVVNASITNLSLGADSEPAELRVEMRAPGVIESLDLSGYLELAPDQQWVSADMKGSGISGTALLPYLPPELSASTTDGKLAGYLSAAVTANRDGGSRVALIASRIRFDDGLNPEPAIRLESAKALIDRFDLAGKRIAVEELSVEGFGIRAFQDDRGIVLPGIVIGKPDPARAATTQPVREAVEAAAQPAAGVEEIAKAARAAAPLVTVKKLSVNADRIAFQARGMSEPAVIEGVRLVNTTPIEMLGDDPTSRKPFTLTLDARVQRLVDAAHASATLAPFATEPSAKFSVDVTGIHADQITTLAPGLAELIEGKDLDNGRFTTEADATFTFTRRGMAGIDLTRDIGANVIVRKTSLTQSGREAPLAGVEEIRGERIRFSPVTGSVTVKSLDIAKPSARLLRDGAGIHALGLTLKIPTTNATPSTRPQTPAEPVAEVAAEPMPAPQRGDLRIDQLTVTGIDVIVEDRAGEIATVIPITELDVDVRGLDTRALREPLPIKFNVLAGAGKAKPSEEGAEREVFTQFSSSGALAVYPKPNGWVKLSLSGLDLQLVRGVPQQFGVILGGGTMDLAVDARMQGTDTFDARIFPTFTDLRVSEPPDGPIRRAMKLTVPLDIAIAAVQGADGAISLPVRAPMKAGQLDFGSIVGSAAVSVGAQMMVAVLSKPVQIGALVGLDASANRDKELEPVLLTYAPGESRPTSEQRALIEQAVKRLKDNNDLQVTIIHTPGKLDAPIVAGRANPSADDARQFAEQLRSRRIALQREQASQSGTLRVALASQNASLAEESLANLREVSAELNQTEQRLDDTLNLLRPGAEKQTDRRTRSGTIELGAYRARPVRDAFESARVRDFAERVQSPRPGVEVPEGQERGTVTLVFTRRAKQ